MPTADEPLVSFPTDTLELPLASPFDTPALLQRVDAFWDNQVLPALLDFMRIPNQSPAFDKDWRSHGHMDRAVEGVANWVRSQELSGAQVEIVREGNRTPVLLVEVPAGGGCTDRSGGAEGSVLIYGHLDKQPPMSGWREGLSPWEPVLDQEGRLYGRGGADDGYAVFSAVAALKAIQTLGGLHPRTILLIECSEESGSCDLSTYLSRLERRLGSPELVLCLDSGCGDYRRLWATTSLRGLLGGSLSVSVLRDGVHSGGAGGIVPNPFRILRCLLDRLEDSDTGEILPAGLKVEIPPLRLQQAKKAAVALGESIGEDFPFLPGVQAEHARMAELIIASSWKSALAVIGQEGIPEAKGAGNVLLPAVKAKLSIRIPPRLDPAQASAAVRDVLLADPPYGAQVAVTLGGMSGWEAPPVAPWLEAAFDAASQELFGESAESFGAGGTIPFMQMIGERFPEAQFLTTGVLGPHSNAHGPNEFLHIPYTKRLTAAVVRLLEATCFSAVSPTQLHGARPASGHSVG